MSATITVKDLDSLIKEDSIAARLYSDPDIFQEELKKIWFKTWVYVGHESEIAEPNTFVMKSIGPVPIIMARSKKGEINLLLNRCTHRGNEVCVKDSGKARFTCRYHAWSFDSDGSLIGRPFEDGFANKPKEELGLKKVARVASYGGFVFGSFAEEGPTLEEHLGGATELIDRLLQNSPSGEIEVTTGFLKHKVRGNWKLLVENETDGYHPAFVHASVFQASNSRIGELYGGESLAVSRDYENGHTENDLRPEFRQRDEILSWFGTSESRLPEYVRQMNEAHGEEKAREIMIDGTPHAMIFPNLFIAEIQIFVIQPLKVDETIQHVTAIQFKGSEDINRRLRQQTMGSVGPAGFLLADDSEIYERTHKGLATQQPFSTYIGRGDHRERRDENGYLIGDSTDDITSRGIWRHYHSLMGKSS